MGSYRPRNIALVILTSESDDTTMPSYCTFLYAYKFRSTENILEKMGYLTLNRTEKSSTLFSRTRLIKLSIHDNYITSCITSLLFIYPFAPLACNGYDSLEREKKRTSLKNSPKQFRI